VTECLSANLGQEKCDAYDFGDGAWCGIWGRDFAPADNVTFGGHSWTWATGSDASKNEPVCRGLGGPNTCYHRVVFALLKAIRACIMFQQGQCGTYLYLLFYNFSQRPKAPAFGVLVLAFGTGLHACGSYHEEYRLYSRLHGCTVLGWWDLGLFVDVELAPDKSECSALDSNVELIRSADSDENARECLGHIAWTFTRLFSSMHFSSCLPHGAALILSPVHVHPRSVNPVSCMTSSEGTSTRSLHRSLYLSRPWQEKSTWLY
jgi:hypothetical protein